MKEYALLARDGLVTVRVTVKDSKRILGRRVTSKIRSPRTASRTHCDEYSVSGSWLAHV